MPEPPYMSDQLRSPPSDEGALNRAPGAFNAQRFKKPSAKVKFEFKKPLVNLIGNL